MVLHVKTPKCSMTVDELLKKFPIVVRGMEGEGEGGDPPAPSGGSDTPPASPEKEPDVFPRDYVEKLRAENADRRQKEKDQQAKIDAFEKEKADREKADMSEVERLKTENAETAAKVKAAEEALVAERKRNAIISEASKLKFRDPEDALAYVNLEDIRMNEDGTPHKTSIESAVKKIADDKKYLIEGPGSGDGGTRGTTLPADQEQRQKVIQQDIAARGGVKVG